MNDERQSPASIGTGGSQSAGDWRGTFQPQARFTRGRHKIVNLLGIFLAVGGALAIAFSSPESWPWAVALGVGGMLLLGVLTPRPWPDCPACLQSLAKLGRYCPVCGGGFDDGATDRRAFCPQCGFVLRIYTGMYYWSKAPVRKIRLARRSGRRTRGSGRRHRYEIVPVRYCMHCRARLGD